MHQNQIVVSAKLVPRVNIFVVSRLDGVIHFHSLEDGTHISYLNDHRWVPLKCIAQPNLNKPSKPRAIKTEGSETDLSNPLAVSKHNTIAL